MPLLSENSWNWTAAGAWGAFLALLGVIVRQVGPWRSQSINAEQSFRDGLIVRVELLEATVQRKDSEAETRQLRFEAERALYRHRINNLDSAFTALLLLLEKGVSVTEAVESVKKMRAEQLEREATEATLLRAAGIPIAGQEP